MSYPLTEYLWPMSPCKVRDAAKLQPIWDDPNYIAEEKIDGCQYICIGGRMFGRKPNVKGEPTEKTDRVPHIAHFFADRFPEIIVTGEVYWPGKKSEDVIKIMGAKPDKAIARQEEMGWLQYKIFDILRAPNGEWLINRPWYERRKILEFLSQYFKTQNYDYSWYLSITDVVRENKFKFYRQIVEAGGEGVVLKHVEGIYVPGKDPMWNWIKVKTEIEDDVVIMGFEPPEFAYTGKETESWQYWYHPESNSYWTGTNYFQTAEEQTSVPVTRYWAMGWIGSIVFGKYDCQGRLIRLGTCSGMTDEVRAMFSMNQNGYIGRTMKITAMEITKDGHYRHPEFSCLRDDKDPRSCIIK